MLKTAKQGDNRMAVTVKTIAEYVGVSRGTVDRALNRRGNVNPEVAARIWATAEELGYRPNLVARALAVKKVDNKKIGVILNAQDNPFYQDVLAGVAQKANEIADFGFEVVVQEAKGYDVSQQLSFIYEMVAQGVNGLILSPINDIAIADALCALEIPVLSVNTDIEGVEKLGHVGSDFDQMGRVAAGLFGISAGQSLMKIGIVAGSRKVLGHNLRIQGFLKEAATQGSNLEVVAIAENNDNDDLSYTVTREMLVQHPDITGLFFCAAGIAGGLKAVKQNSLRGEMRIVTVDLTQTVREHLQSGAVAATICQDPFQQGFLAVETMFQSLLTGSAPAQSVRYMQTQIILKASL